MPATGALIGTPASISDSDEPQTQRRCLGSGKPDGHVDAAGRAALQGLDDIERAAALVLPPRAAPTGTHDDIGAPSDHVGQIVGPAMDAVGKADLARHHRDAIDRLGALLVGDLERAEPLVGQIVDAMDAPHAAALALRFSRLHHVGRVHEADQPALARRPASAAAARQWARPLPGQKPGSDPLEPWHRIAKPAQQRHVRDAGQADAFRPRRCEPKAPFPEAIRKDEAKQIDRAPDLAWPHERPGFAGLRLKKIGSAELPDGAVPACFSQLCVCHRNARI